MNDRSLRRLLVRIGRHWSWARSQGVSRLIEEDELNPFVRVPNTIRKWQWRRASGRPPGLAVPVFLVGLQRSGTNMLTRGFAASPAFEVHNENDRRLFSNFRLRADDAVRAVIEASRHSHVLFKPLCDSHRTPELLQLCDRGRAIWAYRSVDGRTRSALAKFGDANHRVLRSIAAGGSSDAWQAQRISAENLELIRSFDYGRLSPASASALFWYVRNSLYFDLGLDARDDVILSSYDDLISDPERSVKTLCAFLDFPWDARLASHVDSRSANPVRLDLDPTVRRHCDELRERLDDAARGAARRFEAP